MGVSPFIVRPLAPSKGESAGEQLFDWQQVIDSIGEQLRTADSEEQARLYHRLGYVAFLLGDVRIKALEAFNLMLERADRLEAPALRAMAHIGLAAALDTLGQRYASLEHARQAAKLASTIGEQRLLALALKLTTSRSAHSVADPPSAPRSIPTTSSR